MAIRNLNGEYSPSTTELSLAPSALSHLTETSTNGHTETSPEIAPEVGARFARDYRRTTASLEGGDRDKFRALEKRARRIRRAAQAGNTDGPISAKTVRSNVVNGNGKRG